jgi:type IV pilus assembly protein PilQ
VNIVTSDDVTGNVTIRMRNVPWDQALDVILQAKGLGMVRRGNIIRVAPLETSTRSASSRSRAASELAARAPRDAPRPRVSYATARARPARAEELLSSAAASPSTSAPTCSSCATWRAT